MMSLQFAGQSVFVGLGKSRNAVFFSIFRKVIIVIPLIIILPTVFGMGTQGILMAEPYPTLSEAPPASGSCCSLCGLS